MRWRMGMQWQWWRRSAAQRTLVVGLSPCVACTLVGTIDQYLYCTDAGNGW